MARPGLYTKNTAKVPPGPKFWNPKKIPPKYRKIPKMCIFGILGVFFRYFWDILRVNSGSPKFRAGSCFWGVFFAESPGRAISGLCSSLGCSQAWGIFLDKLRESTMTPTAVMLNLVGLGEKKVLEIADMLNMLKVF